MSTDDVQPPSPFQLQVWHKGDTKTVLFKGFYKPRKHHLLLKDLIHESIPFHHKEKGHFTDDKEIKVRRCLNFQTLFNSIVTQTTLERQKSPT